MHLYGDKNRGDVMLSKGRRKHGILATLLVDLCVELEAIGADE